MVMLVLMSGLGKRIGVGVPTSTVALAVAFASTVTFTLGVAVTVELPPNNASMHPADRIALATSKSKPACFMREGFTFRRVQDCFWGENEAIRWCCCT